jgi:hypothetical protein
VLSAGIDVKFCVRIFYIAVGLLISPSNREIIAITNKMLIKPPTVVKKKPIAHPITRMTAMMYNNEFMIDVFFNNS